MTFSISLTSMNVVMSSAKLGTLSSATWESSSMGCFVDLHDARFSAAMISRAEAFIDLRLCVRARFKRRKDASYDFVNPFSNAS